MGFISDEATRTAGGCPKETTSRSPERCSRRSRPTGFFSNMTTSARALSHLSATSTKKRSSFWDWLGPRRPRHRPGKSSKGGSEKPARCYPKSGSPSRRNAVSRPLSWEIVSPSPTRRPNCAESWKPHEAYGGDAVPDLHRDAAVEHHRRSSRVSGLVGGEVNRHRRDLLGCSESSERLPRNEIPFVRFSDRRRRRYARPMTAFVRSRGKYNCSGCQRL